MRRLILPICFVLGACVPHTSGDVPSRAALQPVSTMPVMKTFAVPHPAPSSRSNYDIARDFLDLSMQLESGRELKVLSRFEGPITVRVTGTPPPSLLPDLNRLLHRLRTEAGLDINRVRGQGANITIQAVPRAEIRRHLPNAACFVVPNISNLSQYQSAKRNRQANWSQLKVREKLAIFLPNDSSPQEVRTCLHEELAQAIGPLNDLYRLPDSVFNDDDFHTVLTGFDMLILQAYYAPELRSGMSRREVAIQLPTILSRLNPDGDTYPSEEEHTTPRAWVKAIQTTLFSDADASQRLGAAQYALRVAVSEGWTDHRRGFSHYVVGRLIRKSNPEHAQSQFAKADAYFSINPNTELHRSRVAIELASYAISKGQGETALSILQPNLAVAERYENAAILANLMMLQAEALELTGRMAEARVVRLDSLGWARYGYGADWVIRAKLLEIASLNPLKGTNG